MKKLIIWLMLMLLSPVLPAAAEGTEHFFQPPADLCEPLQAACPGASVEDGYLYRRASGADCGQAILKDGEGFLLAAYLLEEDGWQVTASRQALRQDAAPVLWSQAAAEEWPPDRLDDWGAGEIFDILYEDARYSWQLEGSEWQLAMVQLPVASVMVTPERLLWNDEFVFNTQPTELSAFIEADFPRSLLEAMELADHADLTGMEQALLQSGRDTDHAPGTILYIAPSSASAECGRYFDGTPAIISDMGSGYVQVTVGDVTGWAPQGDVLPGGHRASGSLEPGKPASVLTWGQERYATLYATPDTAVPMASLEKHFTLRVLGTTAVGDWLHVLLPDGKLGYLPIENAQPVTGGDLLYVRNDQPGSMLHLRQEASTSSASLGCYYSGAQVIRLFSAREKDGWFHVSLLGQPGWMRSSFLTGELPTAVPPMAQTGMAEQPLYASASEASALLGTLPSGVSMELCGAHGLWGRVRLQDGQSGWVLLQQLANLPTEAVPCAFPLKTDCDLSTADGAVTAHAKAGDIVHISGPRPWPEWRTQNGAPVFTVAPSPTIWGQLTTGASGYLPLDSLSFGWE